MNNLTILDKTGFDNALFFAKESGNRFLAQNNKKYELIETITITQEEISVIERTQEPDGTPYNFEKLFCEINFKISNVVGTVTGYINEFGIGGLDAIKTTSEQFYSLDVDVSNGIIKTFYTTPASNKTNTSTVSARNSEVRIADSIRRFSLKAYNSPIPVNSVLRIYAVRKTV